MTLNYFSADWCGPCVLMKNTISKLSDEITIKKINVDTSPNEVKSFGIRNIPTFILLDENQNEVKRTAGYQSEAELRKFLNLTTP